MLTETVEWVLKHTSKPKPPFPVEAYFTALDERNREFNAIETKLAHRAGSQSWWDQIGRNGDE